jgi:tetratricopeptide (TPR) repeat protein
VSDFDALRDLALHGDNDAFDAAVAAADDASTAHWLRATRHDLHGKADDAISAYRAALNEPAVAQYIASGAPVRICFNLRRLGQIDAAIFEGEEHLLRLSGMTPHPFDDMIELRSILANIYSGRGEFIRAFALLAEQPPPSMTGILRAQWGWARSVILFQAGYIDEALDAAVDAAAQVDRIAHPRFVTGIDSNIWWIRSVLGERLADDELREIKSRITEETQSQRSAITDELTLVLAYAHANRGEFGEACELIDNLVAGGNLSSAALVRAATVLNSTGGVTAAQSLYTAALGQLDAEQQPVLVASVWRTLAASYEAAGDIAAALECLKAAVEAAGIVSSPNADPLCIEY